jgi:LacI family transcriptional regulator
MATSPNERVSITQVAQEANVSIQTVSRVINKLPGVSIKTRERVLTVIDELGYYPSRAAKAMRGSSRTLGIVGYGLEFYGPSRTLVGAQREASNQGYGVVLELVQDPRNLDVRSIFETMLSNHVDGIIWGIPDIDHNIEQVIRQLDRINVPVVFTDTASSAHNLTICSDNYLGGKLATSHLAALGHTTIGLITGPLSYYSARERKLAWQDALADQGQTAYDTLVIEGDWNAQSGAEALTVLLQRHPNMTAIFASNDQMALGVLHAAEAMGLTVPEDLAVVGYDDIPEAAFFHPPLSSVKQNIVQLGSRAVIQIIEAIESLAFEGAYVPQANVIIPELIIRASSRKSIRT